MLSEELVKTLGLYVNHKVCLRMTDCEDMRTGRLLGYTEDEVILASDENAEERISYDRLEDVFYKGYVTSYQKESRIGEIDGKYTFGMEQIAFL